MASVLRRAQERRGKAKAVPIVVDREGYRAAPLLLAVVAAGLLVAVAVQAAALEGAAAQADAITFPWAFKC